ncbi:unnamed protein product, partial [Ectocarpus fasciculatus]
MESHQGLLDGPKIVISKVCTEPVGGCGVVDGNGLLHRCEAESVLVSPPLGGRGAGGSGGSSRAATW